MIYIDKDRELRKLDKEAIMLFEKATNAINQTSVDGIVIDMLPMWLLHTRMRLDGTPVGHGETTKAYISRKGEIWLAYMPLIDFICEQGPHEHQHFQDGGYELVSRNGDKRTINGGGRMFCSKDLKTDDLIREIRSRKNSKLHYDFHNRWIKENSSYFQRFPSTEPFGTLDKLAYYAVHYYFEGDKALQGLMGNFKQTVAKAAQYCDIN